MLDSTALMSPGPKPVAVRLCFGRVKPGPTGPAKVEIGALVEGLRSRGDEVAAAAAMLLAIWGTGEEGEAKKRGR